MKVARWGPRRRLGIVGDACRSKAKLTARSSLRRHLLHPNHRARRWHTAKRRLLAAVAGAGAAAFAQERGWGALGVTCKVMRPNWSKLEIGQKSFWTLDAAGRM
jgi:hypothetical protein